MLAGSRDFDTVVIGLVGERGREVREFLDDALAVNRSAAVAWWRLEMKAQSCGVSRQKRR